MHNITFVVVTICTGLFAACTQEAREKFWDNYDPIGDAIDNSLEKSHKKRKIKSYESRGATREKAERMAFEDEIWGNAPRHSTPLERHNWRNPSYPSE